MIAYLGMGSNIRPRSYHLQRGVEQLIVATSAASSRVSPVYETPPMYNTDQADFLNMVIELKTQLPPLDLLRVINEVEADCGRLRLKKNGPRTLDIDILTYGDHIFQTKELQIPHPRLHERRFVLQPWVDLAPDTPVPGLNLTVSELLFKLPEDSRIQLHETMVVYQ